MIHPSIHAHCLSLPGASHVVQWMGSNVYKVGGKMFAVHAGGDAPNTAHVTLKCDSEDTAKLMIEMGTAKRAPHLPRGGWLAVSPDMNRDELNARLSQSYQTVVASLTKAQRAEIAGGGA